jgi:hypothetical protein
VPAEENPQVGDGMLRKTVKRPYEDYINKADTTFFLLFCAFGCFFSLFVLVKSGTLLFHAFEKRKKQEKADKSSQKHEKAEKSFVSFADV